MIDNTYNIYKNIQTCTVSVMDDWSQNNVTGQLIIYSIKTNLTDDPPTVTPTVRVNADWSVDMRLTFINLHSCIYFG